MPDDHRPSTPVGIAGLNLPKRDSPLAGLSPEAKQDVLDAVRKGLRVRDPQNAEAAVKLATQQRALFPKVAAISGVMVLVGLGVAGVFIAATSTTFDPVGLGVAGGTGAVAWSVL